jgi:hypothetical protein
MPAQSKRPLTVDDERAQTDDTSPKKRLKTEKESGKGKPAGEQLLPVNGVESPGQIEDELEQEQENEPVEVLPTPILDDLYLDTVRVHLYVH